MASCNTQKPYCPPPEKPCTFFPIWEDPNENVPCGCVPEGYGKGEFVQTCMDGIWFIGESKIDNNLTNPVMGASSFPATWCLGTLASHLACAVDMGFSGSVLHVKFKNNCEASVDLGAVIQKIVDDNKVPDVLTESNVDHNGIFTYTDEEGNTVTVNLVDVLNPLMAHPSDVVTDLEVAADGIMSYVDENGVNQNFNLLAILDPLLSHPTNILTTLAVSATGIMTYLDENGNTTTVDLPTLLQPLLNGETLTDINIDATGSLTYTDENGNTETYNLVTLLNPLLTHPSQTLTALAVSPAGALTYMDENNNVVNYDLAGIINPLITHPAAPSETLTDINVSAAGIMTYKDELGNTETYNLGAIISPLVTHPAAPSETLTDINVTVAGVMTYKDELGNTEVYDLGAILNPLITHPASSETTTNLNVSAAGVLTYQNELNATVTFDLCDIVGDCAGTTPTATNDDLPDVVPLELTGRHVTNLQILDAEHVFMGNELTTLSKTEIYSISNGVVTKPNSHATGASNNEPVMSIIDGELLIHSVEPDLLAGGGFHHEVHKYNPATNVFDLVATAELLLLSPVISSAFANVTKLSNGDIQSVYGAFTAGDYITYVMTLSGTATNGTETLTLTDTIITTNASNIIHDGFGALGNKAMLFGRDYANSTTDINIYTRNGAANFALDHVLDFSAAPVKAFSRARHTSLGGDDYLLGEGAGIPGSNPPQLLMAKATGGGNYQYLLAQPKAGYQSSGQAFGMAAHLGDIYVTDHDQIYKLSGSTLTSVAVIPVATLVPNFQYAMDLESDGTHLWLSTPTHIWRTPV